MRFIYIVPLWPAVLVVLATIGGVCVFIGRYPWVSLGALALILIVCARALYDRRGPWPWRSRTDSELGLDVEPEPESGEYVTDLLKPYRDQIAPDQER